VSLSAQTRAPVSALIFLATAAAHVHACNVPVYRYALERWQPSPYQVVVFSSGELDEDGRKAVEALRSATPEGGGHANLQVHSVDVAVDVSDSLRKLQSDIPAELPCIALLFPARKAGDRIVWSGPLTLSTARQIFGSPAREETARRIADGQTAVWVLLESGDRNKDDAAARALTDALAEMPELLSFPPELMDEAPRLATRLRIEFTLVRIRRDDARECIFAAMLRGSEADLGTTYADEPVAFPVYGRGRTLFAVVGPGIERSNIVMACRFLTGRCSCEVKEENPGMDLLIDYPWRESLEVSLVDLVELPAPIDENVSSGEASSSPVPASNKPSGSSALARNTWIAGGLIVLAAALAVTKVARRRRRG